MEQFEVDSHYLESVQFLESLSIMPKTMPGLDKMKKALSLYRETILRTDDFKSEKIITVAGTNGKGTTCSVLSKLLTLAGNKVGLYTSPHLVTTTERLRINLEPISKEDFVHTFSRVKTVIQNCDLTHFESLTLMAYDYFLRQSVDYIIFEVGLGGTFDATNIFKQGTSIITALGMDHQNILGHTIQEIALNKFGIIKEKNKVIHHLLPHETQIDFDRICQKNNAESFLAPKGKSNYIVDKNCWFVETPWRNFTTNLAGERACENIMTALKTFELLGYSVSEELKKLEHDHLEVHWPGRMQKIKWPELNASVYLSGDHNPQGIKSLISILKNIPYRQLHLVLGVGYDKDVVGMIQQLDELQPYDLYLTETPFKGFKLTEYPAVVVQKARFKNASVVDLLNQITTETDLDVQDLIVVTGSLYLVGQVLGQLK